jgi:acetyl esterase/lipase
MGPRIRRGLLWSLGGGALLALIATLSFRLSPWPGVLLVRYAFERDAAGLHRVHAARVQAGVAERLDLAYDERDADARFDLFWPEARPRGATIVWVHGGGWVSGSKGQLADWARILAGRGHAVATIGYTLAPEATYPTQVSQVNRALAHLVAESDALGIDAERLVLAGDSAGASLVAQVAALTSSPAYARLLGIEPAVERVRLCGLVLFCGPYDTTSVDLEGPFGGFLRTVLWAYSGARDFRENAAFASLSVLHHVDAAFPPTFVSAGNGDPLLPQSEALALRLAQLGVEVEGHFFPPDQTPPLGHEYQFELDTESAQQALEAALTFVARCGE